VTDHEQIRQAYLVDHLTQGYEPYIQYGANIERALIALGNTAEHPAQSVPGMIYSTLQTQAATLAYIGVFEITGCVALLFVPTALLLSRAKPGSSGGGT